MGSFKANPAEEMPSDVRIPGARPVTSFLFLRYRRQSLKVGADMPDPRWNDYRHLMVGLVL
jgi:hypothetical protein